MYICRIYNKYVASVMVLLISGGDDSSAGIIRTQDESGGMVSDALVLAIESLEAMGLAVIVVVGSEEADGWHWID